MQAIILAAGKSTRTYPLTITKPKPLLKVANKTIIEHNLSQLKGLAEEAIIVVGYKQEDIKKFLGNNFGKIKLTYISEDEQLGTAHALSVSDKTVDGRFIVMYGDDIYSKKDIEKCLSRKNCILAKKVSDPSRFGVLILNGEKVKGIVEKPKEFVSNMANAGLYVLDRKIFDVIKNVKKSERNEFELTDALSELAGIADIYCEEVKNFWCAVSYPWNILEANEYFLANEKEKIAESARIEEGAHLSGKVSVGSGTIIKKGAYIEGPVKIGNNCLIGPNCYLRGSTSIGNNCHIGQAVEIKNSIIGENTNVAHLSYIGDSIIGDNCNLAAGTITANLRHDFKNVKSLIKEEMKDTGRTKLGIIMGDNCKTGIHTSFYPGVKIGPGTWTMPADIIKKDLCSGKS